MRLLITSTRCLRTLLITAAAAATLAGCQSVSREDAKVRGELTPELKTLSQRSIDWDNRALITMDENARGANNDLTRFWLLDRPSRLNREPVPR